MVRVPHFRLARDLMLALLLAMAVACQAGSVAEGLAPPDTTAPLPPADSTPVPTDSTPAPPDSTPAPPDTTTPAPPPSATDTTPPPAGAVGTPHWSHIRTSHTDFHYNLTDTERDWMAAHYDMIMGGDVSEWKGRNPGLRQPVYELLATVEQVGGRFDRLRQWFASVERNPEAHELESAFLHEVGTAPTPGTRRTVTIWGTARWMHNPASPGYRAYVAWVVGERRRQGYDGVFFDEFDTGNLRKLWPSAELADEAAYATAFEGLFAQVRAAQPGALLVLNTATYAQPLDQRMLDAAGAGHLEGMNNPLHGSWMERWAWAETQLARGHLVEWVGGRSSKDTLPTSYTRGNAPAAMQRLKLTELAGYYLLRPVDPERFHLELRIAWSHLPSEHWLRAVERDPGAPRGARTRVASGTDALGRRYEVWAREYDRAWVVARPQMSWDAQDYAGGAVTVPLPVGTWRLLRPDGGLGPVLSGLQLRVAEGVVLFRD